MTLPPTQAIEEIQWSPQRSTQPGQAAPSAVVLKAGDQLSAAVLEVVKGNDALLAIGPFKAYARLPLSVVSGQTIRLRVEAADQGLRMVMLPKTDSTATLAVPDSLEVSLFEPVSDKTALAVHARSLVPGQALTGRMTGFEKDGLTLVDFGKFKAFAKIDIPVRPGQTLPLTVVQTEGGIALAVMPHDGASAANHVQVSRAAGGAPGDQAVGSPTPASASPMAVLRDQIHQLIDSSNSSTATSLPLSTPALINLQKALSPASLMDDTSTIMGRLKAFVENSGFYFEKRLETALNTLESRSSAIPPSELAQQPPIRDLMVADLKPNLLILRQFLDFELGNMRGSDRTMLETLKSAVQRAISHIEQQQFTATQQPADPDLMQVFSHLLFLSDTSRHARLKVFYAKKGRDDAPKPPRVSLLLEMDRLGMVRTDLWMMGQDLNVSFFVEEEKSKAAIESEQWRIGEMLKDTFTTVAVSVVVSQKKVAEFDGADLIVPVRRQVDINI